MQQNAKEIQRAQYDDDYYPYDATQKLKWGHCLSYPGKDSPIGQPSDEIDNPTCGEWGFVSGGDAAFVAAAASGLSNCGHNVLLVFNHKGYYAAAWFDPRDVIQWKDYDSHLDIYRPGSSQFMAETWEEESFRERAAGEALSKALDDVQALIDLNKAAAAAQPARGKDWRRQQAKETAQANADEIYEWLVKRPEGAMRREVTQKFIHMRGIQLDQAVKKLEEQGRAKWAVEAITAQKGISLHAIKQKG